MSRRRRSSNRSSSRGRACTSGRLSPRRSFNLINLMKSIALSLTGFALVILAGCKTGENANLGSQFQPTSTHLANVNNFTTISTSQARQELLQPSTENYTVGPGDRLEIEVLGDPTTRESVLVGPDGKIYFYLLPGIDAWGLTLAQVREKIQ